MSYTEINLNPGKYPYDLDFVAKAKDPCKETDNQIFKIEDIELLKVVSVDSQTLILPVYNNYDELIFEFDKSKLINNKANGFILITLDRNNFNCCNTSLPEFKIKNNNSFDLPGNVATLYNSGSNSAKITITGSPILFTQNSLLPQNINQLQQREVQLRYSGVSNPEYQKVMIPITYEITGNPCIGRVSLALSGILKDCNGKQLGTPIEDTTSIEFGIKCGNSLDTSKLKPKQLKSTWQMAEIPYRIIYDPTNPDFNAGAFLVVEYDFKGIPDSIAIVPESLLSLPNINDCEENQSLSIVVDDDFIERNALKFVKSGAPNLPTPTPSNWFIDDDSYLRDHNGIDKGDAKSTKITEEINGRGLFYIDYTGQPKEQNLRVFTKGWKYYISKAEQLKINNISAYETYVDGLIFGSPPCSKDSDCGRCSNNGSCFCIDGKCRSKTNFQNTSYLINISCPIPKKLYQYGPLTVDLVDQNIINTNGLTETNANIEIKIKGGKPPYLVKLVPACNELYYVLRNSFDSGLFSFSKINNNNTSIDNLLANNNYLGYPVEHFSSYNNNQYASGTPYNNCNNEGVIYETIVPGGIGEEVTFNIDLSTLNNSNSCPSYKENICGIKGLISDNREYTDIDLLMNDSCRKNNFLITYNNQNKLLRGMTLMVWDSSDQVLDINQFNIGDVIYNIPDSRLTQHNNKNLKSQIKNKMLSIYPYIIVQNKTPEITINECIRQFTNPIMTIKDVSLSFTSFVFSFKKPNPIKNLVDSTSVIQSTNPNLCNIPGNNDILINATDILDLKTQLSNLTNIFNVQDTNLSNPDFFVTLNNNFVGCDCHTYEISLQYFDGVNTKNITKNVHISKSSIPCMESRYVYFNTNCQCPKPLDILGASQCQSNPANFNIVFNGCLCSLNQPLNFIITGFTTPPNALPITLKPSFTLPANTQILAFSQLINGNATLSSGYYTIKMKLNEPSLLIKNKCFNNCNCPEQDLNQEFTITIGNVCTNRGGGQSGD